jgi:hypothetical protein
LEETRKERQMKRLTERIFKCVLSGMLFSALTCTFAWAQSTAQITGVVKDQSGAILPGVEVTVTQTDTGVKRSAVTNETGTYILPNLPIGPYRLEAALTGFRTYVQTGIVLQVDANPVIDAVLGVGQVSDQIEVQADAALVETRTSGVGTVMDNQRVLELPLNGRNVTELIFLAGMANTNLSSTSLNRTYPTVIISVAGGIGNGVLYMLDGANHNDGLTNLNLPLPFPDALQEFKLETSALPAQYGLHSAAAVNAVTKSGTNEFHGDAFEFLRNGSLNARNFFAPSRDTLKRNQFGGVIGGPIKKEKLFFFAGYQDTPQRSDPSQNIAWVPTPAVLNGDFTTFASAACNNGKQSNLSAAQGFTNNQISPGRFDPAALKLTNRLPVASTDPCGKVNFGITNNQEERTLVSRMDYAISEKDSLYGRFFYTQITSPSAFDGKNLLTNAQFALHNRVYALALGHTRLIGSGIVQSFRISATRTVLNREPDRTVGGWPDYGVQASSFYAPIVSLAVTGGNAFSSGGGNAPTLENTGPNLSLYDDVGIVRGPHQIAVGTFYRRTMNFSHSGQNSTGTMSFNGQTTGLGIADFLLGKASAWSQGNQSIYYNRQHYLGLYAQDTWKITPRFTLSYGVRWEPYFSYSSKYGWFSNFDKTRFDQNVHSSVYVNAPAGEIFPGDSQYACGQSIDCRRWNQFFPRLGLAWDPKGDGRMSVRAAFGIFSDRAQVTSLTGFAQNVQYGNVISLTNVPLSNPWATYPGGNPLPLQFEKNMVFPTQGSYVTHPFHAKPTAVQEWNLSIQRQIGSDWLVTANYVGTATRHLQTATQLNPAVFLGLGPCSINGVNYPTCSTTANTNQRRRLALQNPSQGQYYGSISAMEDGGTGSYNGLFLSAQKRVSHGVSVLANYTFSHCISDLWNAFPGSTGGVNGGVSGGANGYNPAGRKAERSNCFPSDTRHVFNLSVVAQTPTFSPKPARLILSNWQVSPIMKIKSGQFITVMNGVDSALDGTTGQRPNQILTDPYLPNKSVNGWLNPAAFALPAPGTYGNVGRNNILGPGIFQLDLALSRTFSLGERRSIQLRGEAFNLPNHLIAGPPVATINSGTFGKIQSDISGTSGLSAGDQRIIQLGLKLVF